MRYSPGATLYRSKKKIRQQIPVSAIRSLPEPVLYRRHLQKNSAERERLFFSGELISVVILRTVQNVAGQAVQFFPPDCLNSCRMNGIFSGCSEAEYCRFRGIAGSFLQGKDLGTFCRRSPCHSYRDSLFFHCRYEKIPGRELFSFRLCQKRHSIEQFTELINDIIGLCSAKILFALIGTEKHCFHSGFMSPVNIPVHIISYKDHFLRLQIPFL